MVKTSVFYENKIYARAIELSHFFKKITSQSSQRLNAFKYWLINPEQVRAANGIAIFSYETKEARKTFSYAALAHLIILLMLYSFSLVQQKKTPDIMIELGGSPQASSGESQSVSEADNPNAIKNAPKIPVEKSQNDLDVIAAQEIRRLEKKKELELERERKRDAERDRQRQIQNDKEIELERKRELERDRQKIKELEQEKRRELDRLRQQEKQKEKELQDQKQKERLQEQQKQKEKLLEPKKLEKDGTLPPPPAPVATTNPAPSVPPLPSTSTPNSAVQPSSPPSVPASSASGSSNSMSASVSNLPSAAPTLDADAKAAYLTNPKPVYPFLAFKMKIEGKVILSVDVTESGSVSKVSIAESSGNESLDRSALETVKNWKFSPARKNGVMVNQVVRIPITFSLKNR